ncbi:DUF1028 domain-containing protein [Pseudooceanicola aestuarii]|uniref:DUF1028 domain-containing protein n=1 Tax=Pseudooceanicola aestuarii TaxID=2697319 RepID=UPI0013D35B0E|nr:DUF1028 domain-containing protein [Pseudooceanicola aestuarii]
MTFSLLARDPETGTLAAAAATGSLCVGGWVLRGRLEAGLSASQGAAPSTFWGEDVLASMADGQDAAAAVAAITAADPGRDQRQLSALDPQGGTGAFTGAENTPQMGTQRFEHGIAAGNMLTDVDILDRLIDAYMDTRGTPGHRLLAALHAAQRAGGDSRGLLSAALLVLHPSHAPLTLRVDHDARDPLAALDNLHKVATSGDYADWARQVPSRLAPHRGLD